MTTKNPATGNVVTAKEVGKLVNGLYSGSAVVTHDNWLTLRAYIDQTEAREAALVEALEKAHDALIDADAFPSVVDEIETVLAAHLGGDDG